MDPLTHTLTGAVLAKAGAGRGVPLAGAALVIGANLPDVDVLAYFAGADAALAHRRGWTHGPVGLALLPVLLAGALLAWDRLRRRWREGSPPARLAPLLALSYLGILTHPLLDWLNTYGIRLLMPFEERWFYGDTLFIVDPWVWLALGGALFLLSAPGRGRLAPWFALATAAGLFVVGAGPAGLLELKMAWLGGLALVVAARLAGLSPREGAPRRRLALGVLALVALYIGLLAAATPLAEARARAELAARGVGPVEELMAGPVPMNPLVKDVVAATPEVYRYGTFHWLGGRLELSRRPIPRLDPRAPDLPPVLAAALADPSVRGMVGWMRFPFAEVEETEEGATVYLMDARYTRTRTLGFGGAAVRVDRDRLRGH